MKSIVNFTTANTNYPEPDFEAIAQSTKDISRLSFFHTEKMKSLQDKALRVSHYALELEEIIGEQLIALLTRIEHIGLEGFFKQLTEIDVELAKGIYDPETIEAAKQARAQLVNLIRQTLDETIGKFRSAAVEVGSQVADISNVVIAQRIEEPLAESQAQSEKLTNKITEKEADKEQLDLEWSYITASQDLILDNNILEIYNDFIPGDEELDNLDLENGKIEVIKQGVIVAKKRLGIISDGLDYIELVNARKAVEGEIDEVKLEIQTLKNDLKESNDLVNDLIAVQTIDSKRTILVNEVEKLPTAWKSFAEKLTNLSESDITETHVTRLVSTKELYLKKVLEERNQVIIK